MEFTHAESRVISVLATKPGRVLSRAQILNETTGETSAQGDRNVDHLINRIRRKLGDDPKNPKFIGTRYGGGYFWIGEAPAQPLDLTGVRIVIGPINGLHLLGQSEATAMAFVNELKVALTKQVGEGSGAVAVNSDFKIQDDAAPDLVKHIDLTFFDNFGDSEVVIACKSRDTGAFGFVKRIPFDQLTGQAGNGLPRVAELAEKILRERWHTDVQIKSSLELLPIAMIESSIDTRDSRAAWREQDPKISKLSRDHPDDVGVKILKATHLFAGHVAFGWKWFSQNDFNWTGELREIEELCLAAREHSGLAPELSIILAKLLHYSDPAYLSVALDIARESHAQSSHVATSLAIMGQLECFAGNFARAEQCLRQATQLCQDNARMRTYVLTNLCQCLIASGQREALAEPKAEIVQAFPAARFLFEPFLTDPHAPSLFARGLMFSMPRSTAMSYLRFYQLLSGRLFANPSHTAAIMHAPLALFVRRHGESALPAELLPIYETTIN